MKITHAMEARKGPRTFTISRFEDGTYALRMLTEGEETVINGCRLSHGALGLLGAITAEFLQNLDQYEVSENET